MLKRFLPALPVAIDAGCSAADLAALFRTVAGSGRRARVILDDRLVRIWQSAPPANLAGLDELQVAAAVRFETLYGEPSDGWHISGAWQVDRPFMTAAVPRSLLAQILSAAAAAGTGVRSIEARFIAAWNRHCGRLDGATWLAHVHAGVLTLGAGEHGHLASVRACTLPAECSHAWLATHVAREAVRMGRAAPARLALSGPAPQEWAAAHALPQCVVLDRSDA